MQEGKVLKKKILKSIKRIVHDLYQSWYFMCFLCNWINAKFVINFYRKHKIYFYKTIYHYLFLWWFIKIYIYLGQFKIIYYISSLLIFFSNKLLIKKC